VNQQQQNALARMIANLNTYSTVFLHAGQRSGIHTIVKEFVDHHSAKYEQIAVMHPSYLHFNDLTQMWNRRGSSILFNKMPDLELGSRALVIVNEALWQPLGWGTALLAQARGHRVLGVSTNGPSRVDGGEWMALEGRMSYKTKELNPDFDVEHHRSIFGNDVARFERDYLNY
jgi:capsule polysaccharide modification protein KpsS